MKLVALSEAKYHVDPREAFLTRYFFKEDDDEDEGALYEFWSPKKDYLVTTQWEENGNQTLVISYIVAAFDKTTEKWTDEVHPMDWDDSLPDTWELEHLDVYKKVS